LGSDHGRDRVTGTGGGAARALRPGAPAARTGDCRPRRRQRPGAAAGLPALFVVVVGAGGGGDAGVGGTPAPAAYGSGAGRPRRAGVLPAAAELVEHRGRLRSLAVAVRPGSRLPGAAGGRDGVPEPGDRPVALVLAAADRRGLGRAGGAALACPVRGLPLGPAGVQPGGFPAVAAGRPRRRAVGDLRGGPDRRPDRHRRLDPGPPVAAPGGAAGADR